ncbi:MAG: ABC transporter ATP-binding protein [Nonlabens sp.]
MSSTPISVPHDKNETLYQNDDILVEVSGLSKKFCKDLKTSLWYGVKDLIAGYSGNSNSELRPKEFWAVKDVSFTLKRGECLGLIGHNGAGKSTLLKILNGLINPDAGKIVMKGRVGALIELGAGFNPVLSGRENIYNNGAILGFSRKEIENKLEEIIEFAELREFIDMPVRNYSSGMKVRLGFAVAAQMEPDILIVDEVLAVGDMGFVLKCFKTIDEILPKTAIIFVSHSTQMVSRICTQVLLMDKGKSRYQGTDVSKGIDLYYQRFGDIKMSTLMESSKIKYRSCSINGLETKTGVPKINWLDDVRFELTFENLDMTQSPFLLISIFDKEQRPVAIVNNDLQPTKIEKGTFSFKVDLKKIQLSKGIYHLNIYLSDKKRSSPILKVNNVGSFQIISEMDISPPLLLDSYVEV